MLNVRYWHGFKTEAWEGDVGNRGNSQRKGRAGFSFFFKLKKKVAPFKL